MISKVCSGPDCGKITSTSLECPVCLKSNIESYFCSQTCFKRNWKSHKSIHPKSGTTSLDEVYDPFPSFTYTGNTKAAYPLAPKREVPEHIPRPDYAENGIPVSEQKSGRSQLRVLSKKEITKMRKVGKLAREVLDIAAAAVKPGVTTDEIDRICHEAAIERNSYPSPLNYYHFPRSLCTSVNEIICHGIPDKRPLEDGDIVNLDVTIYHDGFHGDLNETYYVGDKAKANPDIVRLVETTRQSLDLAINIVKPGMLFRDIGKVIEKHAKANGCHVVRSYTGHGINNLFHCAPDVCHYANNRTVGIAKPGMTFTIEPMLTLGSHEDKSWPDNWTAATVDGSLTAQFENTLLVTEDGVEILTRRNKNSPGGPVKI